MKERRGFAHNGAFAFAAVRGFSLDRALESPGDESLGLIAVN